MFLNEWHHFYTKTGKFPDNFMSWSWTRYAIFSGWIFCIFQMDTLQKKIYKRSSTNWHTTLSLIRNNKNPKIAKFRLRQKFHNGYHNAGSSKVCARFFFFFWCLIQAPQSTAMLAHSLPMKRRKGQACDITDAWAAHAHLVLDVKDTDRETPKKCSWPFSFVCVTFKCWFLTN